MNNTVEKEPHPDFVGGYNQGYFLAREIPQFANDMAKYMPDTEHGSGFGKGVEQYNRELTIEKNRLLEKEFKDNKDNITVDINDYQDLKKELAENKADMQLQHKDRLTDWLTEKDENKGDMGIDRTPEKTHDEREPDWD